ncbi:ABC transporter substrate-binding protein [Jiangella mangrovi]|uniref:Peptide/nickel transport system substrate-binding protein n=1 Tax=Jiangella mangrovi TaxID=1524084 RepID=A0A7W9LM57_9ACTN|nr:ABC transporter substrate-binding protein [Jiangella mangrovi]MBB5788923.1 peptide/nickel transport system substrate-binding protein [Jiangella mangrovi]
MRHARTRWAAAIGAVGILALAGCGGNGGNTAGSSTSDAVKGGTLNILGAGDVDYMDPNVSYYSVGYLNLRLWSRQLFTYPADENKATEAVPDLATDIPTKDNGGVSDDGLTYTITMRDDARWNTSPARPVTAADLVRGVKRTCNPVQPFGGTPDFADLIVGYQDFCAGFANVPQDAKSIANYIENTDLPGVVATDDTTVTFTLTHPATYFVDMLTLPAFSPAPKEVLNYLPGSTELGQHEISDGPYQVESWEPTKSITYVRNTAWAPDSDPVRKAYVDKIVVDETVSQDSIQQQLQTGTDAADMQFDVQVPPSQLAGLMSADDPNLDLGDTSSTNPYIVFNTASPNNDSALSKPEVRQALEYAINRDDIIQVLGGPKVTPPLTHVLPKEINGSEDSDMYEYDPDKAKQLLADAGYPDGLTLTFLYRNASEGSSKTFQTVQQDLTKAGITIKGLPSPNADFYTKYVQVPSVAQSGTWDLALAGWGPDWYGDAALSFFKPLFSGPPSFPPAGSNFGLYENPDLDALIQQASEAATADDAAKLWSQADQLVMKDAVFFPITDPFNANYHASQVNNAVYIPAFQNFDPANVWLSKGHQGG